MAARRSSGSLYQLLELPPTCSSDDIKRAYRKIALKIHPDKTQGATTMQFQRLKQAHDTLIDPQQRKLYDTFGSAGMQQVQSMGLQGMAGMARYVAVFSLIVGLLLTIQLSLLVAKVDGGKSWSWTNTLIPLWIILSVVYLSLALTVIGQLKDLSLKALLPIATSLTFFLGVSLAGHAVCSNNGIEEWRTSFWVGFFPSMVLMTLTTLALLTPTNVKATLSMSPEYRYKLDLLENLTWSDPVYLKHFFPQLFELCMSLCFYITWYLRAATVAHSAMSFWDVFAPILVRFGVNILAKMIGTVLLARAMRSGDGYTPVDEAGSDAQGPMKVKAWHCIFVPLFYAPAVYTVCMIAAKLEADVNHKPRAYSPSLGVACIFLFIVFILMTLFSCCASCMIEVPDEDAATGQQQEEGEGGGAADGQQDGAAGSGSGAAPPPVVVVATGAPSAGYQSMID